MRLPDLLQQPTPEGYSIGVAAQMESKEYANGIDMDRYPSVVLINALDTPSTGFETEVFLQVGPPWSVCYSLGLSGACHGRSGHLARSRTVKSRNCIAERCPVRGLFGSCAGSALLAVYKSCCT